MGAATGNTALLPPGSVTLAGSGGPHRLRPAPAAVLTGGSTVTVMVPDGLLSDNLAFILRVTAGRRQAVTTTMLDRYLGECGSPLPEQRSRPRPPACACVERDGSRQ